MTGTDLLRITLAGGIAILCAALAIGVVLLVISSIKDMR